MANSIILREKTGVNGKIIVSYDIPTKHINTGSNIYWLKQMINYTALINGDYMEMIKLFYYTGYKEDFEELYTQYCNTLNEETKLFLLKHAHDRRDDYIIKKYITELPIEVITKQSDELNILEKLCMHGLMLGGTSYSHKVNYPDEDKQVLQLVEFICHAKPALVTEKCVKIAGNYNNHKIVEILTRYLNMPKTSLCYICNNNAEPQRIITDICLCKKYLHYTCGQELIRNNGSYCFSCKSPYKTNMPLNYVGIHGPVKSDYIYFPHLGVFPIPLFKGKYQIVSDLFNRLRLSIIYLQYKNINNIFELILSTPSAIDSFLSLKNKLVRDLNGPCNGYGVIIDDKFRLLDTTCSNAPRLLNKEAYDTTELLINKYLFCLHTN
jgi:hypothetical protein